MSVFEDSLGLIPKPPFEPETIQSPSDDSIGLPCDFGGVKIVTESNGEKMKNKKRIFSDLAGSADEQDVGHSDVRTDHTKDDTVAPRVIDFGDKTPKSKQKIQSTILTKKARTNRNIEVVKYFDAQTPHLDSLFKKIGNSIDKLDVPVPVTEKREEKSDVEKLDELLSVKEKLDKQGINSELITKKIDDMVNNMFK